MLPAGVLVQVNVLGKDTAQDRGMCISRKCFSASDFFLQRLFPAQISIAICLEVQFIY